MDKYKVKCFSSTNEETVTVYHTTRVENLPSIFKYGLLKRFQRDRDFENKSLGLNLTSKPFIYLSKNLDHLCIPAVEGKRVVLQIEIPKDIFLQWDRINKGDPMYNWFIKNKSRFNGSWKNFIHYMTDEMCKQDPKLKEKLKEEINQYGSLENTPRFIHGVKSIEAMRPENCLCVEGDIDPSWISKKIITEGDLSQRGIYFGKSRVKRFSWFSSNKPKPKPISPKKPATSSFKMEIEDIFSILRPDGATIVVTGEINSGSIETLDEVMVKETGKSFTVKSIETFRKIIDKASSGDKVGLCLAGAKKDDVKRGMTLVSSSSRVKVKRFSWLGNLFKKPEIVKSLQEIDKDPELNKLRERSKLWKKHKEHGRTWGAPDVWVDPITYNIYVCWSNGVIQYKGNGEYWGTNNVKTRIIRDLKVFLNNLKDPVRRGNTFKFPPKEQDIPDALLYGKYLVKLLEERL